jgi:hypothetical protein
MTAEQPKPDEFDEDIPIEDDADELVEADEADEDEAPSDLYACHQEDKGVIDLLAKSIRGLLRRKDTTPYQIAKIGKFLFALERLPRITEGFGMSLTLTYSYNNESSYQAVSIDSDSFKLSSGGNAYDPAVGGDSYSSTELEIGIGWREGGDLMEMSGWVDSFAEKAADKDYEIDFEDFGSDPIEWSPDDDRKDPWDRIFGV